MSDALRDGACVEVEYKAAVGAMNQKMTCYCVVRLCMRYMLIVNVCAVCVVSMRCVYSMPRSVLCTMCGVCVYAGVLHICGVGVPVRVV